jgi:hypothetical protein
VWAAAVKHLAIGGDVPATCRDRRPTQDQNGQARGDHAILDTNEFALSDLPREERFLIGATRPVVSAPGTTRRWRPRAARITRRRRGAVQPLFDHHPHRTGGKGTGSGTMFRWRRSRVSRGARHTRSCGPRSSGTKGQHYDTTVRRRAFDAAASDVDLNDRGYAAFDPSRSRSSGNA